MGYNVLFVVPQNMLAQEIGCEATTLNKFFSIPVHKGDELPLYDHSSYDVIFFDDIYMSSPYILSRIREFVNKHPNKIIMGAGDVKQLPSIQPFTNTQPIDIYTDNCLDIIFKHNIFLTVCKRVGGKDTEEGNRNRKKLDEMYDDIWIKKMSLEKWIVKHFKKTNDIMKSENHIAYTNARCQAVSNEIRKKQGRKNKYEAGEVLTCRLYRNSKEGKLNVNIRWRILAVQGRNVIIQDIKNINDVRELDEHIVDKHFRYAYCATCHSRQGTSIGGNITIHEWNKSHLVSREWLWCSVGRSKDYSKVYFYDAEDDDEQHQGNDCKIPQQQSGRL